MEIRELIQELQKYPMNLEVYITSENGEYSYLCTHMCGCDINVDGCISLEGEQNCCKGCISEMKKPVYDVEVVFTNPPDTNNGGKGVSCKNCLVEQKGDYMYLTYCTEDGERVDTIISMWNANYLNMVYSNKVYAESHSEIKEKEADDN